MPNSTSASASILQSARVAEHAGFRASLSLKALSFKLGAGCPSFGGQRTTGVLHISSGSPLFASSARSSKLAALSPRQRANAAVGHGSSGPSVLRQPAHRSAFAIRCSSEISASNSRSPHCVASSDPRLRRSPSVLDAEQKPNRLFRLACKIGPVLPFTLGVARMQEPPNPSLKRKSKGLRPFASA